LRSNHLCANPLHVDVLAALTTHFFTFFIFFFQAEDGIRDPLVTGVQTCALPISTGARGPTTRRPRKTSGSPITSASSTGCPSSRSEERRVGKECRSRWSRVD